jgi:uncharacterized protein YggE
MSGTLHIRGVGKVSAVPDIAHIAINVESRQKVVAECLVDNGTRMDAVYAALKNLEVERSRIRTTGFTVRPIYKVADNHQTDQVDYWSVVNSISVKIIDLATLGNLLGVAGQHGSVQGPWFSCSNSDCLEDQCRALAIKDAIRKAKIYTETANMDLCSVGEIKEEGQFQQARAYCAAPMGATMPVETGAQEIAIYVDVQFVVKGNLGDHVTAAPPAPIQQICGISNH